MPFDANTVGAGEIPCHPALTESFEGLANPRHLEPISRQMFQARDRTIGLTVMLLSPDSRDELEQWPELFEVGEKSEGCLAQ